MNRFTRILFTTLAALTLAGTAQAKWLTAEIKWQQTYRGGPSGTATVVRDSIYNVVKGTEDTTAVFSLNEAEEIYKLTTNTASSADTSIMGYLLFATDTTVWTPGVLSLAVEIDGRVGGLGVQSAATQAGEDAITQFSIGAWTKIDSVASTFMINAGAGASTGAYSLAVPIRALWGLGNPASAKEDYNREGRIMAFPELRARVWSATTNTYIPMARVFVRYRVNDFYPGTVGARAHY